MTTAKTFADRLRAARTAAGLTRKELAAAAGLSWQAVRAWEQGARLPGLTSLVALAGALGSDPARLIGLAR